MKEDWNEEDERILDGLRGAPETFEAYQAPPGLQHRIYAPTVSHLQRRRVRQRLVSLSFSGLAYAAGLLTVFLWPRADTVQTIPAPVTNHVASLETPLSAPEVQDDAATLEARAAVAPFEERAGLLRRAADAYMNESGDVANALRCYRTYRALVPAAEFHAAAKEDTWLLLSLRQTSRESADGGHETELNLNSREGA